MKRLMKGSFFLLLIAFLAVSVWTQSESQTSKPTATLRVAALVPGSTGYLYPVAVAPVVEKYSEGRIKLNISPTRGAAESLGYIRDKKMDMGFVGPEIMYQSWYGKGAWEGKPDRSHRVLWVYVLGQENLVVLGDSPIKTLQDLKGKKIGTLEIGSAGAMCTQQIVEVMGWDPKKDVSIRFGKASAGMDALVDKVIDAFSMMAGAPSSLIVNLATTHDYRFIEIPAEIADRINQKYYAPGVWVPYTLPAGTYPKQTSDYKTITPAYCVVIREDIPQDVVYELTKIFFEHQDECTKNYAQVGKYGAEHLKLIKGDFASFHPGALKYYREKGWM